MSILDWAEGRFHKFNVWDVAVFKIYLFLLGAIVGAYFSSFVVEYIWYFVVLVIISMAWLFYKMFAR